MPDPQMFGALELGGTKIVMALGHGDGHIIARQTVPTEEPQQVLPLIARFFAGHDIAGIGVGAFGPIVINADAPNYGCLLQTNKPGWSEFNLVAALAEALGVPVKLVTDVGAAAIGEARLGALSGVDLGVYLTVGTGIGGAIVCKGDLLPAALHPEMGHIALRRADGDAAASTCTFHRDCAEGLASGPAILARWGTSLSAFAETSGEHRLIADYLGQLCANLVLTLSPQRIVLGGGVGQTPGLLPGIERETVRHLGGYALQLQSRQLVHAPRLGQDAGIVGALLAAGQLAPHHRIAPAIVQPPLRTAAN